MIVDSPAFPADALALAGTECCQEVVEGAVVPVGPVELPVATRQQAAVFECLEVVIRQEIAVPGGKSLLPAGGDGQCGQLPLELRRVFAIPADQQARTGDRRVRDAAEQFRIIADAVAG